MKKIILLYAIFMYSGLALAATGEVEDLRKSIGVSLNQVVKDIKQKLKGADDLHVNNDKEVKKVADEIEELITRSSTAEFDPTVLKHGDASIKVCDEDTQELAWVDDEWICRSPEYSAICEPSSGEYKETLANGDERCYQKGTYKNVSAGWGACRSDTGEKQTQLLCMFTNSKDKSSYQVASSNCSNFIQRYEQACGKYGAKSSCKCSRGSYYYAGGKSYCRAPVEQVIVRSKSYNFNFCTDHFTKLRIIPNGNYIELIAEAQHPGSGPDTRCGYRDYSSSWLNAKGLSGWARGAYKRIDRVRVPSGFTNITNFKYTFSSSGSGCHNVSGSGSGNSTNGSSSYGYAYDNKSLTYCPANSAQRPKIRITFNSIKAKKFVNNPIPTCKIR